MASPVVSAVQQVAGSVNRLLASTRGYAPAEAQAVLDALRVAELSAQQIAAARPTEKNEIRATPRSHVFVRVPGVQVLNGGALAVQSPAFPLTWPFSGRTVGVMVGAEGLATQDLYWQAMAGLGFAISLAGSENLVTNGGGPDFVPFISAAPPAAPMLPMERRFAQGEAWQITFRNAAGAGVNLTPYLVFGVLLDRLG